MDNRELFDEVAGTFKRETVDLRSAVEQVCEMFDLTVLSNIEEPLIHVAPCPMVDADGDGCTCAPVQVYAIGANAELSAGLRGFAMSPYFNTMDELEAWCVRNLAKLKEFVDKEELPDASNWA